jgi:hypothetical protein
MAVADLPPQTVVINRWHDSGAHAWKGVPGWIRNLGLCIRRHESIHVGHYRAKSPTSTASGAYQMLNVFWRGNARWFVSIHRYPTAKSAPMWAQDMAFINSIRHGGIHAWHGTYCHGT